jgi:hypothetical protein
MIPLVFMFMLLMVFGILLIVMRATPEQKAVNKRLASIRASAGQGGVGGAEDAVAHPPGQ